MGKGASSEEVSTAAACPRVFTTQIASPNESANRKDKIKKREENQNLPISHCTLPLPVVRPRGKKGAQHTPLTHNSHTGGRIRAWTRLAPQVWGNVFCPPPGPYPTPSPRPPPLIQEARGNQTKGTIACVGGRVVLVLFGGGGQVKKKVSFSVDFRLTSWPMCGATTPH